jgi:hypothetical protein
MPTLSQKETAMRSTVAGVLYTQAATAPTADDDRNFRYIVGSRWLDATANEEYVCLSNEPTAAVWKTTTAAGGGGGGVAVHIDIVAPTTTDDSGDGYVIGTPWLNTVDGSYYVATDVTPSAAVWVQVASGGGSSTHIDTVNPTVTDDSSSGFTIGQTWINTTTDSAFIVTDVTVGAAVWTSITAGGGGSVAAIDVTAVPSGANTGTNVQDQLDNINNAISNVFFWGRVVAITAMFLDPITDYSTYKEIPTPTIVTDVLYTTTNTLFTEILPNYSTFTIAYNPTIVDGYNVTAF